MLACRSRKQFAATVTLVLPIGLSIVALLTQAPSQALPEFSRRYEVTCQACHSIPPRLNRFGLAFQANHFAWPSGQPPANHHDWRGLPFSGIATLTRDHTQADGTNQPGFRTLEIYASDSLSLGGHPGGYFVDDFAATTTADGRPQNLDDAYLAVPLGGTHGQLAVTVGQFTPIMYQYDPVNSLSASLPAALDSSLDDLTLDAASPGARLDFFDNRGRKSADGTYVDVGIPFGGKLALNHTSRLYAAHGAYAHAFHRHGLSTIGMFGYDRTGNHLEGLIASRELSANLTLLTVAANGHDAAGISRRLSVQADYVATPRLAFSGRLEALDGQEHDQFPVLTVVYYPVSQSALRLNAETVQQQSNRSLSLIANVQF